MKLLDLDGLEIVDAPDAPDADAPDDNRLPGDDGLPVEGRPILFDEFVHEALPTEWVVDTRIATRTITVLAGPAKRAKKTLISLHMIQAVARGEKWLGATVSPRPAYFNGFEGGRPFLAQRVLDIGHESALLPGDQPAMAYFADGLAGYEWIIAKMRDVVRRQDRGEKDASWPVLIVVDTLSQVLAAKGIDENSNVGVTNYMRELDTLVQRCNAAWVFIHHFSKYLAKMRGASAFEALCNWCEINPIGTSGTDTRMDWTLRHAPGHTHGSRITMESARFVFDCLEASEVQRGKHGTGAGTGGSARQYASKPDRVLAAADTYFRAHVGQKVTRAALKLALATAANVATIGDKLIADVLNSLAPALEKDGLSLRRLVGEGEAAFVAEPVSGAVGDRVDK